MDSTTIISTWIKEPHLVDGWSILGNPHQVPRPSLWLIDIDRAHAILSNRYSQLLSEAELTRSSSFHQPTHATRYKTTHTMLRILLAGTSQSNPATLQFVGERHNKPRLSSDHRSIAFNLSYTEGKSMIGIADGTAIGIDIEWSHRPIVVEDMLAVCFSTNEINYITSQQDGVHSRFFTLWTRKEAILKLTGEGIGEHLPFFEVLDGACVAQKRIIGGNPPDRVYLYSFHLHTGYVGCYATSEPINHLPIYEL